MTASFEELVSEAVATRRTLHRRPEEGWTEFETTYLIASRLKELGFEVLAGRRIIDKNAIRGRSETKVRAAVERAVSHGVPAAFIRECGELTGAVGVWETGRPGNVTAFRFDIDCVCVDETRDPEHLPNKLGFASEIPGLMHSCGHDAHTAVGLAVARWISEHADELNGTVKLVFQPAEEGVRGGGPLSASGVLDDVNTLIASHIGDTCRLGEMSVLEGGFLATTKLDIVFEGTPSHAGANPEKGKSALLAAAAASLMIEGIPRHSQGISRVSIGTLNAGEGRNVTPAHAVMQMETRADNDVVNQYLVENVKNIVKGVAAAYGVKAEVKELGAAPSLPVCRPLIEELYEISKTLKTPEKTSISQVGGASEDATYLMKRVMEKGGEAAYFLWGCNHQGHHRGNFEIQDEKSIPMGIEAFLAFLKVKNGKTA